MHLIGKIDLEIFSCISADIVTDDVIITERQMRALFMDKHLKKPVESRNLRHELLHLPLPKTKYPMLC